MKSETTQILNEADDMERRLSWILFKQEQDARLFQSEREFDRLGNLVWEPGLPVYPPPSYDPNPAPFEVQAFHDTQRDNFNLPRCEPCGVFWKGEDPCWICGEHRPMGFEFYTNHYNVSMRFEVNTEGFQQAMERAMEAFTGQMQDAFADAGRAFNTNETRRLLGMPEVRSNHDSPEAVDFVQYTQADAYFACEIYRRSSDIQSWDDVPHALDGLISGNRVFLDEIRFDSRIELPEDLDLDAPAPVPMPVVDVFNSPSIGEMSRLIERNHEENCRNRAIDRPVTERRRDYGPVT